MPSIFFSSQVNSRAKNPPLDALKKNYSLPDDRSIGCTGWVPNCNPLFWTIKMSLETLCKCFLFKVKFDRPCFVPFPVESFVLALLECSFLFLLASKAHRDWGFPITIRPSVFWQVVSGRGGSSCHPKAVQGGHRSCGQNTRHLTARSTGGPTTHTRDTTDCQLFGRSQ